MAFFRSTFLWLVLLVGVAGLAVLVLFVKPDLLWRPDHPSDVYNEAVTVYRHGDIAGARAIFQDLLTRRRADLSEKQVRVLEARIALADRVLKVTRAQAKHFLAEAAQAGRAALRHTRTHEERRQGRQHVMRAIKCLEQTASVASESADYNYLFACCLDQLAKRDQAAVFLQRAMKLAPKDPRLFALRAAWYHDAGKTEKALRLARAAVSSPALDPFGCRSCCRVLVECGDDSDVEAAFTAALRSIGDDRRQGEALADVFESFPGYREELESAAVEVTIRQKKATGAYVPRALGDTTVSGGSTRLYDPSKKATTKAPSKGTSDTYSLQNILDRQRDRR